MVAECEAAQKTPERIAAHEENEWNIELVEAAQHYIDSPIEEFEAPIVDVSELAVSEMIAKLEASQV